MWVAACHIIEASACMHTHLTQMPNHFQMLRRWAAFVKKEEGKKLALHAQIAGLRLHETGLVQKIVQLHSQGKTKTTNKQTKTNPREWKV